MINMYLTDSDESCDHEGLYDKTNEYFMDKAKKECLWEQFTFSRKLSVKVCKTWLESQRTLHGKLTQLKSGHVPKEMTECQSSIQDKFGLLRSHIRCKGLNKSSGFKSHARGASASATTAHNISRASTDIDSMEISMWLTDTTLQPQNITSPITVLRALSVDLQVMDHFTQMRTMLSSFLRQKQDTTIYTAFCNYLVPEVERLEEKDFRTFRNAAVKPLYQHSKQGRRTWSSAPATDTFT